MTALRYRTLYLPIVAPFLALSVVGALLTAQSQVSANQYLAQGLQYVAADQVRKQVNRDVVFALASASLLFLVAAPAARRVGLAVLPYVYTLELWLLIVRARFARAWATTMVVFDVPLPSLLWQPQVIGRLLGGVGLSLLFVAAVLRFRRRSRGTAHRPPPRSLVRSSAVAVGAAIGVVAAVNAVTTLVPPAALPHPVNVIWITWDSLRADHLASYGYRRATSPHMDALAEDAVLFETAISQHNWTRPSYSSMLTSRYDWEFTDSTMGLPEVTLAEVLKNHGYRTVGFVQNPNLDAEFDFDQGFDSYVQLRHDATPEALNCFVLPQIEKLARYGDPFFLFIHYQGPHWPYRPDNPFLDEFVTARQPVMQPDQIEQLMSSHGSRWDATAADARQRVEYMIDLYDASIRQTDEALGRVLDLLRTNHLLERSLLIFNSDHGDEFNDRGRFGHAHKNLHPELTSVPLVMRFPAESGIAPCRIAAPVENLDIFPTVLAVAGIAAPRPLSGRNLLPLRALDTASRLIISSLGPFVALRTRRHALFVDHEEHSVSFFDLETDPLERHPLADFEATPEFALLNQESDLWYAGYQRASTMKRTTDVGAPSHAVVERLRSLGYAP